MELLESDDDEGESVGVQLLRDVRRVFDSSGVDKIRTQMLVDELHRTDGGRWTARGAKPGVDPLTLADRLRPYKIKPKQIRVGEETFKGYTAAMFADAWDRYLG
jgi:hypothetical protein